MDFQNFGIENGIMKGSQQVFESGNANLGKWFLDTLKSKPAFVGQVDAISGQQMNYGKMADESVRCALWLKKQGINFDDIVFTCSYNRITTFIPILATFYNGATHIFGYKGIHLQMTRYLFSLLKPKFIFAEEEELQIFEEAAKEENLNVKIISFTKVEGFYYFNDILNESELSEVNEFRCIQPLNPNDNCILALTSGTTSDPKVVAHSYKSIMEGLLVHTSNKEETKIKVSLVYLPLFWLIALRVMLVDVLTFTTMIVVNETSYDLHEAFQLIEKYKVTKVRFSLGMMYRMYKWKKTETYDTSSIKTISFNGVKLPPEMLKFLMKVAKDGYLEQTYGATEMSIPMRRGIMNNIDLNSCGYLYPNMSMKVIDVKTGKTLGPKESGEICFKSPYSMKGYFKDQIATEKAIDPEGWYHTGDLGYYDASGLGYILGRVKNTSILPNGKIVPLWQVERALLLNSEVIETVILSGSENFDSLRVFAFVTLIPGSKITEKELSEIANNFSDIEISIVVKIMDELPLTSSGKIKLSELQKIIVSKNLNT